MVQVLLGHLSLFVPKGPIDNKSINLSGIGLSLFRRQAVT